MKRKTKRRWKWENEEKRFAEKQKVHVCLSASGPNIHIWRILEKPNSNWEEMKKMLGLISRRIRVQKDQSLGSELSWKEVKWLVLSTIKQLWIRKFISEKQIDNTRLSLELYKHITHLFREWLLGQEEVPVVVVFLNVSELISPSRLERISLAGLELLKLENDWMN